ncbi:hypothetical protein ACHAWT_008755 [Skeletonema menzelii]|mmetsp:Transcript_26620/g.43237  ORF Transcript_26620/g.43237 Transcript_26620/m.43237 type:complete len:229 (+) Transcript_26620:169-855(+)|eukprot:scaffold27070_cov147-Skeletonema_menzelii.AAC.16
MQKFAIVLLSSISILPSINAFKWKWTSSSASCAGDPFRNVVLSVTCAQGHYTRRNPAECAVGDTVYAKGSLEATMLFSDGQVIVTPSVAGADIFWDKKTYGHLSDWLYPLGDQKLGGAGFYTISYAMPLPKEEGSWPGESWILNNMITGHITVKNNGECNIEEKDEEEWYPLYNYAIAGLLSCSAIARGLFVKKRKRDCVEGSDDDIDDKSNVSTYYEMSGCNSQEVA